MTRQTHTIVVSFAVGLVCLAGAMSCTRNEPLLSKPVREPRISLSVKPEMAFAGANLEVIVSVWAHPKNRAVFIVLDGGEGFFSSSSFEVLPNQPAFRRFLYTTPRGRDGDGLIVATATLWGELGPLTSTEKWAYRRVE